MIQMGTTTKPVEGDVLKTKSGIEYTEHKYVRKEDGEQLSIRLFRSYAPQRLLDEDETKEEYKLRRLVTKNNLKKYKQHGRKLVWSPYPFGEAKKGLTYNEKNREVMDELMKLSKEKELNGEG